MPQPQQEPLHPEGRVADGIDRRQYKRSFVSVEGRLMLPSGAEHNCQVVDVSEGGIALHCPVETEFRDKVIVYLTDLGRFEGQVVRFIANGFAIETQLNTSQRKRLVERIEWLQQGKTAGQRRTPPRRIPSNMELSDMTSMTVEPGAKTPCKILDISITGAHVETKKRPRLGTHVTVGRMLGRVVRHTLEGIGIEFVGTGAKAGSL